MRLAGWHADVLDLSCWGQLDCVLAVNAQTTLLSSLNGGEWGHVVAIPRSEQLGPLSGLACGSTGYCTGSGSGVGASADAYFLYGFKGLDVTRPHHAHQSVGVSLQALSCPSTGACVAGGVLVLVGDGSEDRASLVQIQRGEPQPIG